MQLLAAAGVPFYSKIRHWHTCTNQTYCWPSAMGHGPGLSPNPWSRSPSRNLEVIIIFGFFGYGSLSKCQNKVGSILCQPQGSHFTAKFNIRTLAPTKRICGVLLGRAGHCPNPWSRSLGCKVEWKIILPFFRYGIVR